MAGRSAGTAAAGPSFGGRHLDARSQARRPGARRRVALGLLLYRCARLAPHARRALQQASRAGVWRDRSRPHSRADRAGDRRRFAGRSRGLDRRSDDPDPAPRREDRGGMRFGEVPVATAEGAILAHSLKLGTTVLKKGRVLARSDVEAIAAAGLHEITVARLDPGDVGEDHAAERVAAAAIGSGIMPAAPFTGRVNLHAEARGVLVFDPARVDRLNLVDEAITLGTLPPFAVVEPRQMVATVKIIPFGAPEAAVRDCVQAAITAGPLLRVAPFRQLSMGLVQTRLPGLKE